MTNRSLSVDPNLSKIAFTIRDRIFSPVFDLKTQVFLCGAERRREDSIRHSVSTGLLVRSSIFPVAVVYPEDIFEEILYGPGDSDLMSLENLLASGVDAIVIIPESPGSIAELGAFVNVPPLRKKIICVIDQKYKKDKSFIIKGPVRLLKETEGSDRVIFIDPKNVEPALTKLRSALRPLKSFERPKQEVTIFQISHFLLPAIYLFEPVRKHTLESLISAATGDSRNARALTNMGLNRLREENYLENRGNFYRLSETGFEFYKDQFRPRSGKKTSNEKRLLDDIRLSVFNYRFRGKELSI